MYVCSGSYRLLFDFKWEKGVIDFCDEFMYFENGLGIVVNGEDYIW